MSERRRRCAYCDKRATAILQQVGGLHQHELCEDHVALLSNRANRLGVKYEIRPLEHLTEFRLCALAVFERLGMGEPADAYLDDLQRLQDACSEWHRLPDERRGGFLHFDLPDLLSGCVQTGNLPAAIDFGWAKNDAAKDFVRFVDERSGKRATLLMLQVVFLIQEAVQAGQQVNTTGGSA